VLKKQKVLNVTPYYMIVAWSSVQGNVWTHAYVQLHCKNFTKQQSLTSSHGNHCMWSNSCTLWSKILLYITWFSQKSKTNNVSIILIIIILQSQPSIKGRYTNQIISWYIWYSYTSFYKYKLMCNIRTKCIICFALKLYHLYYTETITNLQMVWI